MCDTVEPSFVLPVAPVFPWDVPENARYPGQVKLKSYMLPEFETDPKKEPTEYIHDKVGKFRLSRDGPF